MNTYLNHKYNNTVIQCRSVEHGAKIIAWWKEQGIDTRIYTGSTPSFYYGLINGIFRSVHISDITITNITILEDIPQESEYPKVMWVWDHDKFSKFKRVVFMKKNNKYLTWYSATTLEEAEKEISISYWCNAEDIIEEQPQDIKWNEDSIENIINSLDSIMYNQPITRILVNDLTNIKKRLIKINATVTKLHEWRNLYMNLKKYGK